jgi:hypothetical protein
MNRVRNYNVRGNMHCFYIVYAGNENLHTLTKDGNNQLRVDLQDWEDIKKYALYNIFNVGDETTKYQLSVPHI